MTVTKRFLIGVSLILLNVPAARAQESPESGRAIVFPDVPGFLTLKCDFHMHSVFSDGSVWPNIRVQEALRDGLDAISLTDHLEYQPHIDDIPFPDRNRAYTLAVESAGDRGLIVVNGSEITRDMPPGHANAIFLEDANLLLVDDSIEVYREARRQGGFTFWNHPHWTSQRDDGIATLTDVHLQLIDEDLLHGIEVVNGHTYSDEALRIALDHNLAILGTSDIHGLIDWQYDVPRGGHRPVTLVFATERSVEGIRDGLEARRTAVWFENTLIGREEHLLPLVMASLKLEKVAYAGETSVLSVTIANTSDAEYVLNNQSEYTFHRTADLVTIEPHGSTQIQVKTVKRVTSVSLAFEVLNAVTAPNEHLRIVFEIVVPEEEEQRD